MNKAAQRTRILEHIMEHGSITTMEGSDILRIADTRKRISELRAKGYPIIDEWRRYTNEDGKSIRYKVYYLEDSA